MSLGIAYHHGVPDEFVSNEYAHGVGLLERGTNAGLAPSADPVIIPPTLGGLYGQRLPALSAIAPEFELSGVGIGDAQELAQDVAGPLLLVQNKDYHQANFNAIRFVFPDVQGFNQAADVLLSIVNPITGEVLIDRQSAVNRNDDLNAAVFELDSSQLTYAPGSHYQYVIELRDGTDYREIRRERHVLFEDLNDGVPACPIELVAPQFVAHGYVYGPDDAKRTGENSRLVAPTDPPFPDGQPALAAVKMGVTVDGHGFGKAREGHNYAPVLEQTREQRQLSKAFERLMRKSGVPVRIDRNGVSFETSAVQTKRMYAGVDGEGFEVTIRRDDFLLFRSSYAISGLVVLPEPGDTITKVRTGERFVVVNDDDSEGVDDTQPEINKIRVPTRRESSE